VRLEVEEKHRHAWARFFEKEHQEKTRANDKAERESKMRLHIGLQRKRCTEKSVKRKGRN
jgi:hypothetical protein